MLTAEVHWGNRDGSGAESSGRSLDNFYRTYDPSTGRYLETDPIGQAGGLNLFAYVESDPVNNYDPDGRQAVPMGVALPSVAAAAVAPLPVPFPIPTPVPIPIPPWLGIPGAAVGGYWLGTQIEPYVSPIIWPYLEKLADECGDGPDDDCDANLVICLENKFWVPPSHPYGRPLDCGACYRECEQAGGNWPHYKCPLPRDI